MAERFAGFEPRAPARGASEREIAAYGKVLRRYLRELDPDVGELVRVGGAGVVVAVVSPHGVAPREDFFRVLKEVVGMTEASGSFAGPQEGLLVLAGPGVATGGGERRLEVDLVAVLPTLLAAAGLPVAEEMAPPARGLLDAEELERLGIVTIPGYAVKRAVPR